MPRASRNSPRLLVRSSDRPLLYIVMDRIIRPPNDQRAQRPREHGSHSPGPTSFPQFFLHLRELAVQKIAILWQAAGLVGNVLLLGFLCPARATDLKAKIDRCCPNTGSTQRSSTIRRKTQSRLRPNSQTNAHRLTRAAFAARWSRLRRRPPALRTPCVRLDTAMHITQHSKKKSKRAVFGISRVLISCNPRDALKRPTQFRLESPRRVEVSEPI